MIPLLTQSDFEGVYVQNPYVYSREGVSRRLIIAFTICAFLTIIAVARRDGEGKKEGRKVGRKGRAGKGREGVRGALYY